MPMRRWMRRSVGGAHQLAGPARRMNAGTRRPYRRRRDRLAEVLSDATPAVEISGIAAGLHALVHLPGRDERDVVARAREHGLALWGLGTFTEPGYEQGPALVIGYATPADHAYTATLARLSATLDGASMSRTRS